MFFYLKNVRKAAMQAALDAERDEPAGRIGVPQAPQSYADLLLLDPEQSGQPEAAKPVKDEKPLLLWDDA
jgi:hypothetical protein